MSEHVKDGILFVTGSLSDPYRGSSQYGSADSRDREATRAFWEATLTGANLTEDLRRAIRERMTQFKGAVAWFQENQTTLPPNVVGMFQQEAIDLLQSMGYRVNLDPGPMPS